MAKEQLLSSGSDYKVEKAATAVSSASAEYSAALSRGSLAFA